MPSKNCRANGGATDISQWPVENSFLRFSPANTRYRVHFMYIHVTGKSDDTRLTAASEISLFVLYPRCLQKSRVSPIMDVMLHALLSCLELNLPGSCVKGVQLG